MISLPLVVLLNTHGFILLVVFVILYELFVAREKEIALHVLFSVIAVFVFTLVLKELFLIPRPYMISGEDPMAGLAGFSSLPSVHAAVTFCLATTVILHQRLLGVFLFTMAALVSFGRVVANVHYPLDIAVGVLIGILTGIIFNEIHIRSRKKYTRIRRRG